MANQNASEGLYTDMQNLREEAHKKVQEITDLIDYIPPQRTALHSPELTKLLNELEQVREAFWKVQDELDNNQSVEIDFD